MTCQKKYIISTTFIRVTSLEQLSVAEFSDEYAKPKAYENDHRKVLGIWFYVVLKVKLWEYFIF